MAQDFRIPVVGPGSQPAPDSIELEYMSLPKDMRVFEQRIVEVADIDAVTPALTLLRGVARACEAAVGGETAAFYLDMLGARNRALIDETLGEGEVSCKLGGGIVAQESVFAGVWLVRGEGPDRIEVGPAPHAVIERAFEAARPAQGLATPRGSGVVNAPSILTELLQKSGEWTPQAEPHVVNLTLLPHTPEDLDHLAAALGEGAAKLLSRGYGDCRIEATATPQVWRVRFFNAMGALILDTFEVTAAPSAALAAKEDFEDSAERIEEVLEAMR